ncbi:MAG: HAD family phosphatase [Bacteroidales bacterium]|jgi:putative hydrolase of the HAD superfamily|nr:HAD family phosphatase [Bacteroidales bacterium]
MDPLLTERLHLTEKTTVIKTLIFDFGGVLIDLNKDRSIKAFADLGIPAVAELLNNWCQKGIFLLFEEGKISSREFLNSIRNMSQHAISDEEIKKAFFSFLVDLPRYKLALLSTFRKHYKLFLLSNINEMIYNYSCESYFHTYGSRIEDYFDKLYLSFEMKVCKPHKKIFEMMLDDAGILPEESLFLEDGEKNIQTAQLLGFNTFLVKPEEDFSVLFEHPLLKRP